MAGKTGANPINLVSINGIPVGCGRFGVGYNWSDDTITRVVSEEAVSGGAIAVSECVWISPHPEAS